MQTNTLLPPATKGDEKTAEKIIKLTGLTGEIIERLVKSSNEAVRELGLSIHYSSYGKTIHQFGPICKLIEIRELKADYDELKQHGHSSLAAFAGSGAGIIAKSSTFMGGASLTTAGVLAMPEAPPVGAAAIRSGILLMRESENIGKVVKHQIPIIVDSTLDKFTELYTSTAQFVRKSYKKFHESAEYKEKKYENVESAMLALGFKEHVRELYKSLDQHQQLVYSTIARDLFNEYFKLNQDKTIKSEVLPAKYNKLDEKTKPDKIKQDIDKVRLKLCETTDQNPSDQVAAALKEQNKKLKIV